MQLRASANLSRTLFNRETTSGNLSSERPQLSSRALWATASMRSTRSPLVQIFRVCLPQCSLKIVRSYVGLSTATSHSAERFVFIITKAGKPLVKVVPLETPEAGQVRRLGFMAGQIEVPDDFDRMGEAEIEQLFGGSSLIR
jgi:hypothetical protein